MSAKLPWNPTNAVAAFTAALTRAGFDRDFRNRLTGSTDSARTAVAEAGNLDIPTDKVIMFHEDESNENYHVFYLPDYDEQVPHKQHEYSKYFQGCYSPW